MKSLSYKNLRNTGLGKVFKCVMMVILLSVVSLSASGQKMIVESMTAKPFDISASKYKRYDLNNQPCALVKVLLAAKGATFEGNVIGDVDNKVSEYWVYMSKGTRRLRVKCPNYLPVMVEFADYGVKDLESNTTYELVVSLPVYGSTDNQGQPIQQTGYQSDPSIEKFEVNGVTFEMVYVPGGTFTMGATAEQGVKGAFREGKTHSVTLSGYYIGKYEVTQAQWKAVMGNNPSEFKGDNLPVEKVSWNDCQEFIKKLNEKTGKKFSLPTEAQWEYAARGGKSGGTKYSGSDSIEEVAWFGANSGKKTHPVGMKKPNSLGIYDMTGNVSELCQDWHGDYSIYSQMNPTGPWCGTYRVRRGGSFSNWDLPVSISQVATPRANSNDIGFRLALCENQDEKANETENVINYSSNIEKFKVNGVEFEMVYVPGGTFTMGATEEQGDDVWKLEKPIHSVTLSGYYIGKYEVTQAQWEAVMGEKRGYGRYDLPVECVSWNDCQEFIKKLNELTGKKFSLPTEAQWEYAARGGKSGGTKYSGSKNIKEVAWYRGNSEHDTHPVGTKLPNSLGIYDMSGNVWEWCQDYWGEYASASQTNPTGPDSGSERVIRGGDYRDEAWRCRVSHRFPKTPDEKFGIGFRFALSEQRDEDSAGDEQNEVNFSSNIKKIDVNGVKFEMVFVPGGIFTMGATGEQGDDAREDENPAHSVALDGYYIGKYEVTQGLWKAIMGNNPSRHNGDDNLPVECVSWEDCQKFIKKLNKLTGKKFSLPTEAQWEYAARGGKSGGTKYSGSDNIEEVAWNYDNSGEKTHPVGMKKPNSLGIYDMSGNVHEWCHDWYGAYSSGAKTNPKGPESGSERVNRGGSRYNSARDCRVSERGGTAPDFGYNSVGFRLCLSISEQ